MSTATLPPVAPAPTRPALTDFVNYLRPGQRLAVTDVTWEDYERLLAWRDEHRRGVRIAFDQGEMEVMVTGGTHERLKGIVALLIEVWAEETGGDCISFGNVTHARGDIEKGIEPDECFYIQNWAKVTGARDIDFTKDPPPDLAVEIEVSRTVLSRQPIYAAFKVPEVWRYNGTRLAVLLLQPDGTHTESPTSRALPTLPVAELPRFLAMAADVALSNTAIGRRFREWVRALPPAAPPV